MICAVEKTKGISLSHRRGIWAEATAMVSPPRYRYFLFIRENIRA